MNAYVALIRAIGPETHEVMSMTALREAARASGLEDVSSYIATGNLLFRSIVGPEDAARLLAGVIAGFGLANPVFLRTPEDLAGVLDRCPFPDAAAERPSRMLVSFMDREPEAEGVARLLAHPGPERVAALGREVYVDYVAGVGRSKLTPAAVERRLGMPGTARNWTTIGQLAERARLLAG